MKVIAESIGWGFLALLLMAVAYGIGLLGAAAVEFTVRALLFLRKGCPVGVGMRLCTPCTRMMPCLLYRRGRFTCLLCETRHPAEAAS